MSREQIEDNSLKKDLTAAVSRRDFLKLASASGVASATSGFAFASKAAGPVRQEAFHNNCSGINTGHQRLFTAAHLSNDESSTPNGFAAELTRVVTARRATTPIDSKGLPVATPTQAGSLCYATLTPSRASGRRAELPSGSIRQIARHFGEQCSIGFQPVSGFGDETGLNPNGPFQARTIPIRTLSSRRSAQGFRVYPGLVENKRFALKLKG
jgi:hypothetical protein